MGKIKLKTILYNREENSYYKVDTVAVKSNKIKFISDDVINLITLGDIIEYKRSCKDYEVDMFFDLKSNTSSKYYVNNLGYLNLKIDTKKIVREDNYIEIDYIMDLEGNKNSFNLKIEMEDI